METWLTELLCLNACSALPAPGGYPTPDVCDLYYINRYISIFFHRYLFQICICFFRDTLFCYHKAAEGFLQRLMALYVASHYKNTPNDLQMLSDAPAHHLFCLLGPVDPKSANLPEIIVVIQVKFFFSNKKNS